MSLMDVLKPATVTVAGARLVVGKCGLGGMADAWDRLEKDRERRRVNKQKERERKLAYYYRVKIQKANGLRK